MTSGRISAIFIAFSFSLFSWSAIASEGNALTWAGCGITKKAFMQELATAYEKETGKKIDIEGGGATKGIRKVATLEKDMGGTCRYLLPGNPADYVHR